MPVDHAKIDQNGWRQGSLFTPDDSAQLLADYPERPQLPGTDLGAAARLILISHSCDVVHPRDQEPRVEVIPAKALPVTATPGDAAHGRIARRLRLQILIDGNPVLHELHAPLRFTIVRERLHDLQPDPSAALTRTALNELTYWLTLRYRRQVFPGTFDRRLGDGHKKLRKFLRPIQEHIVRLLYSINTEEELPEGQPYHLRVVLIARDGSLANDGIRAALDDAIDAIETILDAAEEIELDDIHLRSDSEFSLAEYESFNSWGFEELSIEGDTDLPPAQ